ncbi:phospholipase A and acyltransferase 4 [Neosynchiropus ocellatus]
MDYQEQIEEIVAEGKYGDLIEFAYPIGYSHWGVYVGDGHVVHFAIADEGQLMANVRNTLQSVFPLCGDLLLGETKIRRVPIGEVNVPKGAHILISNKRHAFKATPEEEMRERCEALVDESLRYNLFCLNCEHFATFVRYGKAVCNQVPGKSKNEEYEQATEKFQDIVNSKKISGDLFK